MVKKNFWKAMPLLAFVLLFGCMKDEETADEKQEKLDDELVMQYIENNNIQAERDDAVGFYYSPITLNPSGRAIVAKDIIYFKYKLSLLNGTVLEDTVYKAMHNAVSGINSIYNRSFYPFGIDLGLAYMKEGEKFLFITPSYLAYYNYSINNKLPPYSNLAAEIEVLDIISKEEQEMVDRDSINSYIERNAIENVTQRSSGLYYVKTQEGTGQTPATGQLVRVKYKGELLDGTVFDSSSVKRPYIDFEVGKGQVIKGWDEGIALMKKGEKGTLFIPSHLAYYQSVFTMPLFMNDTKIPPFSVLIFDVELVDIL